MKRLKQFFIIIAIVTLVHGLAYSEERPFGILTTPSVNSLTKEAKSAATTLDLSWSFPPYATIRLWLDNKHGFELYPPNQYKVLDVTGAYFRYMYKFYDNYYLGIGCLGISNSSGQTAPAGWFGTLGTEFNCYFDWLIMDLGLAYFPNVPSNYSLWPTTQIGVRFKI